MKENPSKYSSLDLRGGSTGTLGAKRGPDQVLFRKERDEPERSVWEEDGRSSAARFPVHWPSEECSAARTFLNGACMIVIDALAVQRADSSSISSGHRRRFLPSRRGEAFMKLGGISLRHAVRFRRQGAFSPTPTLESLSLRRRRMCDPVLQTNRISALTLAETEGPDTRYGMMKSRQVLRGGTEFASKEDRNLMASRLIELVSRVSWYLQEGVEDTLVALQDEAAELIAAEISSRMKQPEDIRSVDLRLRALLRIANRYERT